MVFADATVAKQLLLHFSDVPKEDIIPVPAEYLRKLMEKEALNALDPRTLFFTTFRTLLNGCEMEATSAKAFLANGANAPADWQSKTKSGQLRTPWLALADDFLADLRNNADYVNPEYSKNLGVSATAQRIELFPQVKKNLHEGRNVLQLLIAHGLLQYPVSFFGSNFQACFVEALRYTTQVFSHSYLVGNEAVGLEMDAERWFASMEPTFKLAAAVQKLNHQKKAKEYDYPTPYQMVRGVVI